MSVSVRVECARWAATGPVLLGAAAPRIGAPVGACSPTEGSLSLVAAHRTRQRPVCQHIGTAG